MKNFLVGIPAYLGVGHTIEAIESAQSENSEVLVIDNNSEKGIKDYIYSHDNLKVITNEKNEYVNPAWNQLMEYFLEHKEYDVLCIMNSDLILPPKWDKALDLFYDFMPNNAIPVGTTIDDKTKISECDLTKVEVNAVDGGIAGIFICLTRKQCEAVYPIPHYIKIWWGDNWCFEVLRMLGHKTFIYENLKLYHAVSQNVSKTEGISALIEIDREMWNTHSEQDKKNRVEIIKNDV